MLWYRDNWASPFSSSGFSQATAVYEQSSRGIMKEADPRTGLLGDDFRHADIHGEANISRQDSPGR